MGQTNAFQYGIIKPNVSYRQEVDDDENRQHQQHDMTLLRVALIQLEKL
jgi:hypothetical protein